MKLVELDAKAKKLLKYTNARLTEEGWGSIYEFTRKSRVPYTMETVRKVFNHCDYKKVGPHTLAIILHHLNVPPHEIRHVLKTMTSDNEFWRLLPEDSEGASLTPGEEAWLSLYRKCRGQNAAIKAAIGSLKLGADIAQVDIEDEARILENE